MIKRTIGGKDVWFGKIGEMYIIIRGKEMIFSTEKPITDQEIETAKEKLQKIRNEISILKLMN